MLEPGARPPNQNRSPFLPSPAGDRAGKGVPGEGRPGGSGVGAPLRAREGAAPSAPAPGGRGDPTGRSGADTTPSPATTASVSPRALRAAGLTLQAGTEDLGGPDTDQAPLDTVTDPHTGDRTKNGSSSVSLPGRAYPPPPLSLARPPHLFPLGSGCLRLSVIC